jgi:hypothetical protein
MGLRRWWVFGVAIVNPLFFQMPLFCLRAVGAKHSGGRLFIKSRIFCRMLRPYDM